MTNYKRPRGQYVLGKISKVRWLPSNTRSGQISPSFFVYGSWDEVGSSTVELWHWPSSDILGLEFNEEVPNSFEALPRQRARFTHDFGDVNDLVFINQNTLCIGFGDGTIAAVQISQSNKEGDTNEGWVMKETSQWKKIHDSYSCGLSCSGDTLASAGYHGDLILLNSSSPAKQPLRVYSHADSSGLNGVKFIKSDEVATINLRGQVKLWDLRSQSETSSRVCGLPNGKVGLTSIDRHPVQPHVLVTGGEDGVLAFWDMRKEANPITLLSGHSDAVLEVLFHESQPDHLFSCSRAGEMFHWNGSAANRVTVGFGSLGAHTQPLESTGCIWLNNDTIKNRVERRSPISQQPLPIRSFDVQGSSLLVGGDNEIVHLIENLVP